MASSVFYRFKSQKESTRIAFDGTGISVFELKREIIVTNKLGDGTDFELTIASEDGDVYDDDTTIIPRSTTVIARRLPASRPGKGGAARYVSGKMPVNAKTSHRLEQMQSKISSATNGSSKPIAISEAQTEEEREAAVLQMGQEQWARKQQEMAKDIAVPIKRGIRDNKDVPDRPPPPGYVCYRCQEKGHWIQACPTNDDPNFQAKPRPKRTTGIPRSFLRTVKKSEIELDEDGKLPAGYRLNAEGDIVFVEADKASWERYQAKTKQSATAQEEAAKGSKELQEKGLECTLDKRMFIEPMKTPCCQSTYCNDCITNHLLDNDLRCPNCKTEILLDDLKADTDKEASIRAYEAEEGAKKTQLKAEANATDEKREKSPGSTTSKDGASKQGSASPTTKKRKAEEALENERKAPPSAPKGPASQIQKQMDEMNAFMQQSMQNPMMFMPGMPGMPGMSNMPNMQNLQNMPGMPAGQWPMGMNGSMGMNMGMAWPGGWQPGMPGMPPAQNGWQGNSGWQQGQGQGQAQGQGQGAGTGNGAGTNAGAGAGRGRGR